MLTIHKKVVVNEYGKPMEVIIPWKEYEEVVELLGLDLEQDAVKEIQQAYNDRVKGNKDAYVDLDSI